MVKTSRRQTRNHNCDAENQQMVTICLESYIVKKLNCKPPWFGGFDQFQNCESKEEWDKFNEIIMQINGKNSGCITSNCMKYSWTLTEIYSAKLSQGSMLQYNLGQLVNH